MMRKENDSYLGVGSFNGGGEGTKVKKPGGQRAKKECLR